MTITYLAPDGVEISAQRFRQAHAALYGGGSGRRLGGRSGFRVDTPSTILTATSTTWTLTPCAAQIDPGASTYQGMYGWASDANVTGSVTAADATYARKDIVYIQINDSTAGDGSGAVTANVLYTAGTPSATPVAPALGVSPRERSFLVGTITVPVSGGGSPTVVLNPARFAAAGGVLPVDSTEQAALTKYSGLTTSRGGILEVTDGTNWNRPGPKVIPSPASQVGSALAATAFTSGTNVPVIVPGTVVVTTDASGYFSITYPAAFPNGVLSIMLISGDASVGRNIVLAVAGTPFTQTVSTLYGSAVTGAGVAVASTPIRVNYVAYGF